MADNATIDPGNTPSVSVATDDIGGNHFQRVKLIHGADGVNAGDVSTSNGLPVQVLSVIPGTSATSLGKAESSSHTSGDTGVPVWAVRNDSTATSFASNGQYSPISVTSQGGVIVSLTMDGQESTSKGILKLEDAVHTSGDALVPAGAVRQDTLSASCADGDYGNLKINSLGRLYTESVNTTTAPTVTRGAFDSSTGNNTWQTFIAAPSSGYKWLRVYNNCAAIIYISLDSTNYHFDVPAGKELIVPFYDLGLKATAAIKVRIDAASTGYVYGSALE